MNGVITQVSDLKTSRQPGGDPYYLVIFELEDGTGAKSFICPTYDNFPVWRAIMREGARVIGLLLRSKGIVDADSPVKEIL